MAEVTQQDIPIYSEWTGVLDGFVNAKIRAQVPGYLLRQCYREGSKVKKGDLLFEIDPRPFQAVLDQALAQLGKTELDVKRLTPLAKEQAVSQQELDDADPGEPRRQGGGRGGAVEPRFHPDHFSGGRHRRNRHRPDRRPGRACHRPADGRLDGGPDQGLLPGQRTGISEAARLALPTRRTRTMTRPRETWN